MDELPNIVVGGVIVVAILSACLLIGSCVQDYAKSTPRAVDVLVVDKHYYAGHYVTHCSSSGKGHVSCSVSYVPPSWTVDYSDEQRWTMSVSKGTWDALTMGERKVLRFDEGGGYWHARYNERFVFGPIAPESGAWPTR